MSETIFSGTIIHCENPSKTVKVIENGYVLVREGRIIDVGVATTELKQPQSKTNVIQLKKGQFLIPGLIDCHIHAPQFPNIGLGYDKQLLDWLETYTFPEEVKYDNVEYAKRIYSSVVKTTLENGTTTASYFATTSLIGSLVLADTVRDHGQRALVGLVNMCRNAPVDLLHRDTAHSMEATEKFVDGILKMDSDLILPSITPRFAISCTDDLLANLGNLAKRRGLHVQSHISENHGEIDFTLELFKDCPTYADVYRKTNLLTNKTIMAHAVHLRDEEIDLLLENGTSVAHCPSSNTNLRSGLCNVRRLLNRGLTVGLGTDVSGGNSPSILQVMRDAMAASIHLSFHDSSVMPLDYLEVFYLATMGGAKALSLDEKIGNFESGKSFDALVIDMTVANHGHLLVDQLSGLELLQKFVYTAGPENISRVYIAGKCVKDGLSTK